MVSVAPLTSSFVEFEQGSVLWHLVQSPWVSLTDPEKLEFVSATAERLSCRGPREYFLVGTRPDGTEVEIRLMSGVFRFEGLSDIGNPS